MWCVIKCVCVGGGGGDGKGDVLSGGVTVCAEWSRIHCTCFVETSKKAW